MSVGKSERRRKAVEEETAEGGREDAGEVAPRPTR
jgi:hypothetical protein